MSDKNETRITVVMKRDSLEDIPERELPVPYDVRWYRPGDEEIWTEIQRKADLHNPIGPETFWDWFGGRVEDLQHRQCFLLDAERREIGTATAWMHDEHHDPGYARVHWIAVVPEFQHRQLAKPLLTIVLNRMRELGHTQAFLTTESVRTVAIRMYAELGFEPEIQNDQQRREWTNIQHRIRESYG